VINTGTAPLGGASDQVAVENLAAFLETVRTLAADIPDDIVRVRVAELGGEPIRVTDDDGDGWFAWDLPFVDGEVVRVRMPGVGLARLRATTAAAPRVYVSGNPWWWPDAVGQVVQHGRVPASGAGQ
jgi:hypothetical protein